MSLVLDHVGPSPEKYPADVIGAVRYIAPRRASGIRRPKCITPGEIAMHKKEGHQIGFVYEDDAGNALGGAAKGDRDGKVAVAEMLLLGVPRGVAIYAAVDRDIVTGQFPTVAAYLDAFHFHTRSAGFRRGVYGEYDVVVTMLKDGHTDLGWQASAWSHKRRAQGVKGAVLYQRIEQRTIAGTVCDINEVWADDWGQWDLRPINQQEDDMFTDADRAKMDAIHAALLKDSGTGPSMVAAVAQTYYRVLGLEPGKGLVASLIGKIAGKLGAR